MNASENRKEDSMNEKAKKKKKKAAAKDQVKRVWRTNGKCQFCPEVWDQGTDTAGWELDKYSGRWITCPSCFAYKRAVRRAEKRHPKLYWEWFSCRCKKALDKNLTRVGQHDPDCGAKRQGKS